MPLPSTEHVAQAFERLGETRDFQVIREHLQGLYAEAIARAVESTDLLLIGRAQGAAQTLGDLLSLADPASNRRRA